MAYGPNELVTGVTSFGSGKRVWPTATHPKTLAAVAGAPLYAELMPMAWVTATGFWVVWATGTGNGTDGTIRGFLDAETQTHATQEVLANMIMEGKIHADDVPVPAGQTLANLKIALRDGMRSRGFDVSGLDAVH